MTTKFPVPPTTRTARRFPDAAAHATAFRDCFERYQECLEFRSLGSSSPLMEEVKSYILDFEIAAKRSLASDNQKSQVFRKLFLENHSADDCCASMKMDRFTLASTSRQMQSTLGDALVRRGLFPLNKYFTRSAAISSPSAGSDRQVA